MFARDVARGMDQAQTHVRMDQKLVVVDAGGEGRGNTLEIDIDILR